MKLRRVDPIPPPPVFTMDFSKDEGWAIVAALREYAENHEGAARQETWAEWSRDLDRMLRS